MTTGILSPPLEAVSDEDVQELCKYMWDWQPCGACLGKSYCTQSSCPWSQKDTVWSSLVRYKRLVSNYLPEYFTTQPALSCHKDLHEIMQLIKDHPDEAKEQLMQRHFSTNLPAVQDQHRAFNLAASVLLSLNCGLPEDCNDEIEDGASSFPWTSKMPISTYIKEAFATGGSQLPVDADIVEDLTLKNLRRKAGLKITATDDLRTHLTLDPKLRILYVFGSTATLEQMLLASMQKPDWCLLPRGLLLEVLHTIYTILLPPGRESQALLLTLAKKGGFDKDMLRYTTQLFRRDDDPEVDYSYFGERLAELHDELRDPSPRNWFERIFEGGTKSAERKMLMATTIGVFIAVTIGLFGLVIAGFQAWVGYQQWKHPVKDT